MITPLEMARLGIRYFIKRLGWTTVAKIVRENKPTKKESHETKPASHS